MKFRDLIFKTDEQLQREAERKEFKRIQREHLDNGEIKVDSSTIVVLAVMVITGIGTCIIELFVK